MKTPTRKRTRVVEAPAPVRSTANPSAQNRIRTATVAENEDVRWEWTDLPEGGRVVTGYTTVKRKVKSGA